MAYHDLNGNIMIDEQAAMEDVRKAGQAVEILKTAADSLKIVILESEAFQGSTADAIKERATLQLNSIMRLIAELEEMQNYIRRVVAHYQALDRQWKAKIEQMTSKSGG